MNILKFVTVWVVLLLPFFSSAFSVSASKGVDLGMAKFQIDVGRFSGHEEITRQSINIALAVLQNRGHKNRVTQVIHEELTDLRKTLLGPKGGAVKNPIIRGNFATDVPDMDFYKWEADIKKIQGVPDGVDYHTNPSGQTIHFLRNMILKQGEKAQVGTALQSAQAACYEGRERILLATEKGYEAWVEMLKLEAKLLSNGLGPKLRALEEKKAELAESASDLNPVELWVSNTLDYDVDNVREAARLRGEVQEMMDEIGPQVAQLTQLRRKAMFLFGHGTHILQDSFSPAHSLRDQFGNFDISDICYYDPAEAIGSVVKDTFTKDHSHSHVRSFLAQVAYFEDPESDNSVINVAEREAREREAAGKVCRHETTDMRDGIWIRTQSQLELTQQNSQAFGDGWSAWEKDFWSVYNKINDNPKKAAALCASNYMSGEGRKRQCLKHEVRLARAATIRYFVILVEYMMSLREKMAAGEKISFEPLRQLLNKRFFEGNYGISELGTEKIMAGGVLRCDHLGTDRGVIED